MATLRIDQTVVAHAHWTDQNGAPIMTPPTNIVATSSDTAKVTIATQPDGSFLVSPVALTGTTPVVVSVTGDGVQFPATATVSVTASVAPHAQSGVLVFDPPSPA